MLYSKIEGSGKPLIIIHGFLGMSDNWKTLGSQYAESGFETHLLDLRNHGRSFHSDVFTYEAMSDDLLEYCEQKSLSDILLMGHSMGGKVAMLFATRHPEYVEKLIIADIGPRSYRPHHDDILDSLAAVDFTKVTSRQEVEDILALKIHDEGTRQFLMKSLYWKEAGKLSYRFNLDAFIKNKHIIGEALPEGSKFEKPVLFISGENSDYIENSDHEEIRNHFPSAQFEVISDAGHWLHAENPTDYFKVSTQFINS